MSKGRWVEAWDATSQKFLELYIEQPNSYFRGTTYVLSTNGEDTEAPLILGADGKPIRPTVVPTRQAGFRR